MEVDGLKVLNYGAMDILIGIIATLASLVMFLHPVPIFYRVCKKKDIGCLLPYPYVISTVNYIFWYAYAMPPTGTTIQFRNLCNSFSSFVGIASNCIFTYIFWNCCPLFRFQTFGFVMCVTYISPIFMFGWLDKLFLEQRDTVLGPLVIVLGTLLYATPIFNIMYAVRLKRADYLPIGVLVTSSINAFAWMVYACLPPKVDLCLLITHGFGTIITIVQLGVAYEIQSLFATGKQTTQCRVNDDEDNKFNDDASTPLLNDGEHCPGVGVETTEHNTNVVGKQTTQCRLNDGEYNKFNDGASTPLLNDEEHCPDDGVETTEHNTNDYEDCKIMDVATSSATSSSFPSGASFFGGALEHELETKFNEFGLSEVMSYAVASYFGSFHAALYVEKNMCKTLCDLPSENSELQQLSDKLNLSNSMLSESADQSHVKLKEFREAVGKESDEVWVKSKEFLEVLEEKGNEVKIKLKEFLEAVGMEGDLDF